MKAAAAPPLCRVICTDDREDEEAGCCCFSCRGCDNVLYSFELWCCRDTEGAGGLETEDEAGGTAVIVVPPDIDVVDVVKWYADTSLDMDSRGRTSTTLLLVVSLMLLLGELKKLDLLFKLVELSH